MRVLVKELNKEYDVRHIENYNDVVCILEGDGDEIEVTRLTKNITVYYNSKKISELKGISGRFLGIDGQIFFSGTIVAVAKNDNGVVTDLTNEQIDYIKESVIF